MVWLLLSISCCCCCSCADVAAAAAAATAANVAAGCEGVAAGTAFRGRLLSLFIIFISSHLATAASTFGSLALRKDLWQAFEIE